MVAFIDQVYLSAQQQAALSQTGFFNGFEVGSIAKYQSVNYTYAVGIADGDSSVIGDTVAADNARFEHLVQSLSFFDGGSKQILTKDLEDGTRQWIVVSRNSDGQSIEMGVYHDGSNDAYIFKALNLSDDQWDLASGESDYLGDKSVATANKHSIEFWQSISYDSTVNSDSTAAAISFFLGFPDKFKIADLGSDSTLSIPSSATLTSVQNIAKNLSYSLFHNWEGYVTSGYGFDQGYFEAVRPRYGDKYHAGIDFSGANLGVEKNVYAPIDGHVIEKHISNNKTDSFIVLRELDGDKIWVLGHLQAATNISVGSFVSTGTLIGSLYDTVKTNGVVTHPAHLHVTTAASGMATNLRPIAQDPGSGFVAISQEDQDAYVNGLFPRASLDFGNIKFSWLADSGWNAFGLDQSLVAILDKSDSPLQAFFEEKPFSAVGLQSFDVADGNVNGADTDFYETLKEIGGGAEQEDTSGEESDISNPDASSGLPPDVSLSASEFIVAERLAGAEFYARYTVTNSGGTASEKGAVQLYLSLDEQLDSTDIFLGSEGFSSLQPDGSDQEAISGYLPSALGPGTYQILFVAGVVDSETETQNNLATVPFVIDDTPDLVLDRAWLDFSWASFDGAPELHYEVKNIGGVAGPTTQLGFYLSDTASFSGAVFLGDRLIALDSGEVTSESFVLFDSWKSLLDPSKDQHLFLIANHEQSGPETNLSNNMYEGLRLNTAFMTPTDLMIEGLSLSNNFISPGDRPTVTLNLRNLGERVAVSSEVGYFASESSDLSDAIYLGDLPITVHGRAEATQEFTFPASWIDKLDHTKTYYIFAVADHDGNSGDISIGNNSSQSIELTFANSAPTNTGVAINQDLDEGSTFDFVIPQDVVFDSDEDALTFTATLVDGSDMPSWVNFDAALGRFWGSAPKNYNGILNVQFTASDGTLFVRGGFSLKVNPINDEPTGVVTIAGTARHNQVLSAITTTLNDNDGIGTLLYRWFADGSEIIGADSANLRLGLSHVGKAIRVEVQWIDGNGTVEILSSGTTSLVVAGPIVGTTDGESVPGTTGNDTLKGLAGNDVLIGVAGNDTLYGGSGDDSLNGGVGNDRIDGGSGSDWAYFTGTIATTINLSISAAQITGHGADTVLHIENISSGSGRDKLIGSMIGNNLSAGSGNDRLIGAAGNDTLFGGPGNDSLKGGIGADQFVFTNITKGTDVIADFNALNGGRREGDVLRFDNLEVGSFAYRGALAFTGGSNNSEARVSGDQVLVDINGDAIADIAITLNGLTSATQLAAGDFIFL